MVEDKKPHQHLKPWAMNIGANPIDRKSVNFRVWAPYAESVKVRIIDQSTESIPLEPQARGYYGGEVADIPVHSRYVYVLNDSLERPDPASRHQPEGVHGPSQIVDPQAFQWSDSQWSGLPLEQFIIYELHTGTFTQTGTFDGVIERLPYLRQEVGVTAVELMPVAQCPGVRNWGYDGVCLFAAQTNYGGPEALKRLVDACHRDGMAVILDVVYNHLGPEGNYLGDFGPYFTDVYRTPWGPAVNYDGPGSDEVRHWIITNALYWIHEFHIDALRLDAIHGIFDFSARHILQDIQDALHREAERLGRKAFVIAESDLNDSRVIFPVSKGGYGVDGQWCDDFHHALHTLLTKEQKGYYQDFGSLDQLALALQQGFVYTGQYSPHRKRRHGNSPPKRGWARFVVCDQNHDQVGNRAQGDRHTTLIPFEALKVSTATVLLSPHIPLLFMGEEYGERNPFLYFIDHEDANLVEAVRNGRKAEFADFGWTEVPDPYALSTFERSRLTPIADLDPGQQALSRWVHTLIELRKNTPALGTGSKGDKFHVWIHKKPKVLAINRQSTNSPSALVVLSYDSHETKITLRKPEGLWQIHLDSEHGDYGGKGCNPAPRSLKISQQGTTINIPPYAVWIYLTA